MPSPAMTLSARTVQLKSEYSWSINNAIEAGRPGLAAELAESCSTDLAELGREQDAQIPTQSSHGRANTL